MFIYKSRFKEDFETAIDLRNESNNIISVNPLGMIKVGSTPPTFNKNEVKISGIVQIAYKKFQSYMKSEEYPIQELTNMGITVPSGISVVKSMNPKVKGIVFVDKTNLYIGEKLISGNTSLSKVADISIDNASVELQWGKHADFTYTRDGKTMQDNLYVCEYIVDPSKRLQLPSR
jgi:hypothetical protein